MSGHSKFANIKHKKEKNDAAKGKIFTVIGREIAVAVKEGGADVIVFLKELEGLLAGGGLDGLVAGAAQIYDDEAADGVFVLKDKYFLHRRHTFPLIFCLFCAGISGASGHYNITFSLMVAEDNKI